MRITMNLTTSVAALVLLATSQIGMAQQTTPSTSPGYRTTNGNQIGSNQQNGSATSGDRQAMSDIQAAIRAQRAQAERERQQRQQQPASGN